MNEIMEEILASAKAKIAKLPLADQAQVCNELANKFMDMGMDAYKEDYLLDGIYC